MVVAGMPVRLSHAGILRQKTQAMVTKFSPPVRPST